MKERFLRIYERTPVKIASLLGGIAIGTLGVHGFLSQDLHLDQSAKGIIQNYSVSELAKEASQGIQVLTGFAVAAYSMYSLSDFHKQRVQLRADLKKLEDFANSSQ